MNMKDKKIVTEKKRRLKDGFSGESFDATREDIRRGYAIGKDGRKQYTYDAGHDVNEPQSIANFDADENHYSRDDSVQYRVEPRIDIQDANQGTAYQRLNNWSRIVKDFDKEADGNYSERGLGKRIREFGDSIIESENFPSDGLYLLDKVCELLKKYSDLYAQYFSYTDSMGKTDYESPFDWKEEIKGRVEKSKEERKNHMKWSGKQSKLPESVEIPFNGMSVANMRFLGEGINDGYEPMSDEDINAQHSGWWFSCVGLEQDGLTVEIQFPNADDVDFDSSRVLWFSKSEYARNPYGLDEHNDVWLSPDIRDDVYSAANRCFDLLSDGEEKVFKTPEEFRDWLYEQDQIPNGYDNDGYDSMDDNALPEDF